MVRTGCCAAMRAGIMPPEDCITCTRPRCRCATFSSRSSRYRCIRGESAALTTVVEARSYSRNSGRMRCEVDTGIPRRCNATSTRFSVAGFANEKSSEIAAASAPLARTFSTRISSSAICRRPQNHALRTHSLRYAKAQFPRHHAPRCRLEPVIEPAAGLPSDRNRIFESCGRDKGNSCALTLQHRVRPHCCSMSYFCRVQGPLCAANPLQSARAPPPRDRLGSRKPSAPEALQLRHKRSP